MPVIFRYNKESFFLCKGCFVEKHQDLGKNILYENWSCGVYNYEKRLEFVFFVNMEIQATDWRQSLYEQKAAGMILYGRALGLSYCEAEDVLQETFLALMELEKRPDDPVNYCVRSFRNRVLNYRRSLWRRLVREWESISWFESSGSNEPAEQEAMRCLENLPTEQREVIVLKIWNQFTFETIGGLLNVSPNTVAGRYRYGMNKLRTVLKEKAYERDGTLGKTVAIVDSTSSVP